MGKIILKILNIFRKIKKLKKKKYSLESLLRIYEENLKTEEKERIESENAKSKFVKYIYVHEPCVYYLDSKSQPSERKLQFYPEIDWGQRF